MQLAPRHYPDWKAPSEDGRTLIWPAPGELLRQTLENHRRLSACSDVKLQGVALGEIRRAMRQHIGHDDALPLVATGHQTELYHGGVWVKDALIDAAARKLDGQAFHIAVDTDSPKHLAVRWPGEAIAISDDPHWGSAAWCGMLRPPTPAHLDAIAARLNEAASRWGFEPMLPQVLASLRRQSMESLNLCSAVVNALHELDWQLGLRHHVLIASPIWTSDPFLVFAHHVLSHAHEFAWHYNAALAAFRKAHDLRSRTRPMPDLFIGDESIEVPFWLDDLHGGVRSRPSVFRRDGGFVLELASGEEFAFDPSGEGWGAAARLRAWLVQTRHRLSPRALTLTAFVRLLLADEFVHGIGGGRYDQVTDQLIRSYFGIEPPGFAVTTATLYFPLALGRQRASVPCVLHEGHRLKHSLLGDRKLKIVAEIDALPRCSRQRSQRFVQMHSALSAAAVESEQMRFWHQRLREMQDRQREDQLVFDRELFYAIQPRERLVGMIGHCARAFEQ